MSQSLWESQLCESSHLYPIPLTSTTLNCSIWILWINKSQRVCGYFMRQSMRMLLWSDKSWIRRRINVSYTYSVISTSVPDLIRWVNKSCWYSGMALVSYLFSIDLRVCLTVIWELVFPTRSTMVHCCLGSLGKDQVLDMNNWVTCMVFYKAISFLAK